MAVLPFTLPSVAGWPKIWGPQDERCPISIVQGEMRDSEAHWRFNGEDMPALGNGALKNAIISIALKDNESVENDADELKTIF